MEMLFKVLARLGVPPKNVNLVRLFHENVTLEADLDDDAHDYHQVQHRGQDCMCGCGPLGAASQHAHFLAVFTSLGIVRPKGSARKMTTLVRRVGQAGACGGTRKRDEEAVVSGTRKQLSQDRGEVGL